MVIWSDLAKADLKRIHGYISNDSQFYAKKVIYKIIEDTDNLIRFPKLGRIVPEIGDTDIREIIIYSYRIIYEISQGEVYILTIIHGKQEFSKENVLKR